MAASDVVQACEANRYTRRKRKDVVNAESDTDGELEQPARKKTRRRRANSSCSKFPFLSLPIEIRYMIYNFSMPLGDFKIVNRDPGPYKPVPRRANRQKDIRKLQKTCRTIASEFRQVIYRRPFIFSDMKTLKAWLNMIGPQNRQQLRSIKIGRSTASSEFKNKRLRVGSGEASNQVVYRRQSRSLSRLLLDCDNLRNLELNFRYCFYSLPPLSLGHTTHLQERYAAEILHTDFWEFFNRRLGRGDKPESLCWIVKAGRNNFYPLPGSPKIELTTNERQWTHEEHTVAEYLMLLLWRDVDERNRQASDSGSSDV